jgi:CHAT domain
MTEILDLAVTLTAPPMGAAPEVLASIALRCDALGLSQSGDLLTDPLTKQEREDLQWYLEEYWQWPFEQFLTRGQAVEALLPQIGKHLYTALFGSVQADRIVQKWLGQPEARGAFQLSLISDLPAALSLPWELLHSEHGYLALRTRRPISIVRRLPQSELTSDQATPFTPPLRILLVTARPEGQGFLDPRGIARELLEEVQAASEAGTIAIEFLRPPTLSALQQRLGDPTRPAIHILHFDGHGTFGTAPAPRSTDPHLLRAGAQGMLAFETEEGTLDPVKAEDLAQTLQDSGVQLAVLTACQSAMGSAEDIFSSVAARLIRGGIKAVSAMSASLLVVSAARYTEAFYRELVGGASAALAQARTQRALYANRRRHTVSRDASSEGAPVELYDWWLPHFYQQAPLLLQPTTTSTRGAGKKKKNAGQPPVPHERLSAEMPAVPRYSFVGRSYELLQLERWLGQGKLVLIHGFGGMGKTALAREAADWLTRTGMFAGACFVSL